MHVSHDRRRQPLNANTERRRERGSAFIVALLVLLVLTISGLAVTLMTQTELRIGSNERTANRSLYASDSGVEVATARKLYIGPEYQNNVFQLNTTLQDTGATASTTFADTVTITPMIPLAVQYCNLCMVNKGLSQSYSFISFVVNSTAARGGANGTTTQAIASKLLSSTISMQPQPSGDAINPFAAQLQVQY